MKAMKRTIAGLLASLMLMSSVSVSFGAETYTAEEAVVVAKVNAAGIMTGTDNGFEPSKTLTRAEAAAIMVRMKGIPEAQVKSAAGTTLFGDVSASHWAAGYINVASSLGIIKGVGDNKFAPDTTVTIAEMTTMAVRALGAGQLVEAQAGTWPTNYMNFAGEEKLTDGVYNVYTAEASRINAATIVANTLEADVWEKSKVTTNNEVTWEKQPNKNILNSTLEIEVYDDEDAIVCESVSTKDNEFNGTECVDTVDLTDVKVGLIYDVWYNEDGDIIGVWETEGNDLKKISFTEVVEVDTTKEEITFLVNGSEKTYDYDDSNINASVDGTEDATIIVTVNETDFDTIGATFNGTTVFGEHESLFGTAYLDGSDVVAIYAEIYSHAGVVEEVTDTKVKFDSEVEVINSLTTPASLKIDEDNEYFLTRNGKSASFDDLEEGDAVYWYVVGTEKFVVSATSQTVDGEVTSVNTTADKTYIRLDGTKYETELADEVKAEDEIVAYLNRAGKIVMFKEVESAAADIAVVKYLREVEDKYGKYNVEVELFLTDGTTTDRLTLDLENTADEFIDLYTDWEYEEDETVDEDADKVDKEDAVRTYFGLDVTPGTTNIAIGDVICYEISGDELTIVPVDTDEPEFVAMAADSVLEVGSKLTYIVGDDNVKYYLDDNTKVFNVKADDTYEVKVEEVDVDSLDDMDPVDGYVAGIDEDDNTVKYVVFDAATSVKRASDANFAVIEKVADAKYDGEKALEVEVIFIDGERETYYYVADEAEAGSEDPEDVVLKLVDLTIVDDLIVDVDLLANGGDDTITVETVANPSYLAKIYSRGTFDITNGSKDLEGEYVVTKSYELADEVLVLEYDADEKEYNVVELDDMEEYDEDADDNYKFVAISTYVDDASEDDAEVVFIIFQEV